MKKQKLNKIDQLITKMSIEFSKIPNFDLTQTDGDANRLFNLIIAKTSDLQDFKTIYQQYFIPATKRAIVDTKKELKTSIYRKLLNVSEEQLKENYYDTIRLGYVGLFHKIENFVKDLLEEANTLFNEDKDGKDSIENYFKNKKNFRFNNWRSDITIDKINWICNCVKHYGGYPRKEPKYKYLSHLSEDEKIKIEQSDFFNDIDYVINSYFKLKLSQIFSFAVYKMAKDEMNEETMSKDLNEKYVRLEEQFELLMKI